jgi:protein SCO1/2
MWNANRWFVLIALCLSFVLFSCRNKTAERRYELKGKVVSVDPSNRQVMIAHEEIKGYMDSMTMPFTIGDDWAVSVLAPGQTIEATLVVTEDRSWIEGLRISKSEKSNNAAITISFPEEGVEIPDFTLINQDNKRIHLHQYRGDPLLITFIYTRCPLPDYCPLTSRNFSEIHKAISSSPNGKKAHLLTVSFDSAHDLPNVLRLYAGRYMNPPRFQDWEFATGSSDEIKKIAGYFGLIYSQAADQITHSLVTALIGADGKLVRLYQGNRWTPKEILAELK